jgi:hypothetical protein
MAYFQECVKISQEGKTWNIVWWWKGVLNAELLWNNILVNWMPIPLMNYKTIKCLQDYLKYFMVKCYQQYKSLIASLLLECLWGWPDWKETFWAAANNMQYRVFLKCTPPIGLFCMHMNNKKFLYKHGSLDS